MRIHRKPLTILSLRKYLNDDIKTFLRTEYNCTFIDRPSIENPITKVDLILFIGGKDIHHRLYEQKEGHTYNTYDQLRDMRECVLFNKYPVNIPKLGICRGAQLITALSGGDIIQNVYNHRMPHKILTDDSEEMFATSSHHQMMYPHKLDSKFFKILATSASKESSFYSDANNKRLKVIPDFKEPEIVYYNNTKSLAIQGHPEKRSASSKYKIHCLKLIDKLLKNEL